MLFFIILMTLFIWMNSMLEAGVSAEHSGFITRGLNNFLVKMNIHIQYDRLSFLVRKTAHFGEFYFLGILWGIYIIITNKKLLYIVVLVFLTACIDESIQLFSQGRAFQVTDILIDTLGGGFAYMTHYFFNKNPQKNKNSKI